MKKSAFVIGMVALLSARLVAAHDMWIVADVPGAEGRICARIGETFPATVNAPTADRVTLFQFHSGGRSSRLEGLFSDKQFCAPKAGSAGVAEMIVHPRLNSIDAPRFAQFAKMEGLEEVIKQGPADTGGDKSKVKYIYSRYSKAVIGTPPLEEISRELGHVLEIIPKADPQALKEGELFPVLILFKGAPLKRAQVAAVHDGGSGESGTFPVVARTNDKGIAQLRLNRQGLWYARLIYTIPANDPEFQWHHFFSTLTFHIGSPSKR